MARTGRVRLSGKLLCADRAQAELVRVLLPGHIRLSRAEPGCLAFSVTSEPCGLIWLVEETFTDRAAFDAHQARTRASDWGRQTAGIRRAYQVFED
ncbi:MAG: putative quinol monooxygenase [Pararhodobacter sp.]